MKVADEITIEAPAAHVWDILAHRFAEVGSWATAIAASRAIEAGGHQSAAPVAGRACETGVALAPHVEETIVAYDEVGRSFSYVGDGLPAFVASARNDWRVSEIGADRCKVRAEATVVTRGPIGRVLGPLMAFQFRRTGRAFLQDLKHYAEEGQPSPRKRRQLARRDER
jgi:hypothetical protein